VADVVYAVDGDRFVATRLAAGPWDPSTQHGGPAAALLAHAMERHEPGWSDSEGRAVMARVTTEMLRPITIGPVTVDVRSVQQGRRAHRLEASMYADGKLVARGTGLRVVTADVALPPDLAMSSLDEVPSPPEVEWASPPRWITDKEAWGRAGSGDLDRWENFMDACEYRIVEGTWDDPGRCAVWVRTGVDMVEGVGTTPLMRVVATSDMSAGVGRVLSFDDYTHPNADLNVHLSRYPEGEWIGMRALMWAAGIGLAIGEGALYDRGARIGSTTQACIVSRR
jgi:acyl-coenzyme A thioesterase PaaI-like protein